MGIDGKRIFLCSLNGDNIDDYLEVYRKASGFSKIYSEIPDLWNTFRDEMRRSLEKEESDVKHYMIVKKGTSDVLGYFELTYHDRQKPEVGIAIAEAYRGKGYGYEAAKTLIQYIFETEEAEAVIWSAFSVNAASRRIAEKLGGILIDGRDVIKEVMVKAGFAPNFFKGREQEHLAVSYEIRRSGWKPL